MCNGGRVASKGGASVCATWKRGIDVGDKCQDEKRVKRVGTRESRVGEWGKGTPSMAVLMDRKRGIKKEGAAWSEKSISPSPPIDVGRCAIVQDGDVDAKEAWFEGWVN
jgi:hypothetical protein